MRKKLMTLLIVVAIGSLTEGYEYSDYNWHTYNDHEYAITLEWSNWNGAKTEAEAVGGYLVKIDDMAENDWLTAEFPNHYTRDHYGDPAHSLAWIGLEHMGGDQNIAENWQWYDGSTPSIWPIYDPPIT